MSVDCLALVANRTCVHRFKRMVTKKQFVTGYQSPWGSVRREHTEMLISQSFLK